MKNKNKKLIIVLSVITSLFLLVILYLVYFNLFISSELNNHYLNSRNEIDESKYRRGTIFDINGNKLVYSEKVKDKYKRFNKYDYLYSSIIGYNSKEYGKSGLELKLNNILLNIDSERNIFTRLEEVVNDYKEGSNIYLTIDDRIQSYAYDLLDGLNGAIIVSNPKTGAILSMVTRPTFNVNMIDNNLVNLKDIKDGLLLNKATQGLYEPGSIFKIISSIAILREGVDQKYNDIGYAEIGNNKVYNFDNNEYGKLDLRKALEVSSNAYFVDKSKLIKPETYEKVINDFGINLIKDFSLSKSQSIIPFNKNMNRIDKAYSSFGQGKLLMTPLDMLSVINGIANNGKVYSPYIIDRIENKYQNIKTEKKLLSNKINSKNANLILSYLKDVSIYNGFNLNNNISLAGKTGTAETSKNNNIWYLGIAPVENPKYSIVVMIENTESTSSGLAEPIAADLLNYIFETLK